MPNLCSSSVVYVTHAFANSRAGNRANLIHSDFAGNATDARLHPARPRGVQPRRQRAHDYGFKRTVHGVIAYHDCRTCFCNLATHNRIQVNPVDRIAFNIQTRLRLSRPTRAIRQFLQIPLPCARIEQRSSAALRRVPPA